MLYRNQLHAYQERCVKHLKAEAFAALLLEMGLGKTVSTLTAADLLINEELAVSKILVVGPKQVVENVWTAELTKWAHLNHLTASRVIGGEKQRLAALKEDADLYLVSRDNIVWLCCHYGGLSVPFDMLVVDELSSFKNPASKRFKALRRVLPSFSRRVGLTGTPAPNGMMDLWSQIYILDLGERLGKTITEYRNKYFIHDTYGGFSKYTLRKGAEKIIYDLIGDICISMKSKDYLDMPERVNNFIEIDFGEKLMARYKEFEREKVMEFLDGQGEGKDVAAMNAAALTNKLLQFANGAVYSNPEIVYDEDYDWEADKEPKTTREVLPVHGLKLDAVEEIVEAANGKPVLIFWTYRHDLARLLERLKKYKPKTLKESGNIDRWNAGEIQVLLMHPASGGHGLNLQGGGHIAVWFGQTWSLELKQQADARLDRQGQKNQVIIHHLIAKGTIDQRVIKTQNDKSAEQDGLMDAVKALIKEHRR